MFYAGFEDFFGVPSHAYNEGMTLPPLEKKVKKKKESSLNNFDTRIIDRYHKIWLSNVEYVINYSFKAYEVLYILYLRINFKKYECAHKLIFKMLIEY